METTVKLKQKSVGLSFAGGGAKSFAELATLEALNRQKVKISIVHSDQGTHYRWLGWIERLGSLNPLYV